MLKLWTNSHSIARQLDTIDVKTICGRRFYDGYEVVQFLHNLNHGEYVEVEMENGKRFQFRFNGGLYDVSLHAAYVKSTSSEWMFW